MLALFLFLPISVLLVARLIYVVALEPSCDSAKLEAKRFLMSVALSLVLNSYLLYLFLKA